MKRKKQYSKPQLNKINLDKKANTEKSQSGDWAVSPCK